MDEEKAVCGIVDHVLTQPVEHLLASQDLTIGIADMPFLGNREIHLTGVEIHLRDTEAEILRIVAAGMVEELGRIVGIVGAPVRREIDTLGHEPHSLKKGAFNLSV
jgi:hypothetical protein